MKPLVHKKAKRVRQKPVVRLSLPITKGDTVQVISGDDKGKRGKVLRVYPKTGRVTIDGVNVVKRHRRATQTALFDVTDGLCKLLAPIMAHTADEAFRALWKCAPRCGLQSPTVAA